MRYILIFILAFAFFACGDSQVASVKDSSLADSTEYIRKLINAEQKEHSLDTFFSGKFRDGVFSGCVLVAQRGQILFQKAYGWENHEQRDSLSLESSFQLASVSKQFTAAAILLLVQDGKLKLEDSIRRFYPGLPYYNVTVHHLLTHRAGLDKYTNICDNYYREKKIDPPAVYTNDSVINLFTRLNVRVFRKPDTKYDYSNTGYVILAALVEKVSGLPFHEFMRSRIFAPLQMNHTWIYGDGKEHQHRTRGYYKQWNRWDESFLDQVAGDKGVFASVGDMYIWDRALRSGKIISLELQRKAYTAFSPELKDKERWNYGYGWRIVTFEDGATAVFHNGWWHGYTSAFYRGLTDDVTIIMLCNKFNRGIYNVQPVLSILGAHHYEIEEENNAQDSADAGSGTGKP
jgi:CubicO group peptidase (beta-lactamase class C family)